MQITLVQRNKINKDMLSIYIDGEFSFTITEQDYFSLNLYEKMDLTKEEIQNIIHTVNSRSAKAKAVKYLAMKLRSEMEMRKKLEADNYHSETVEGVIEELKAMGYINDKIYAQKYVFDRSKLKPKSKRMLKYELINKGIAEETANEVLSEWEMDDNEIAETLARKKFGKYDLDDDKVRRKLQSFLSHRGYSCETINNVIGRLKTK